jgi:hypothetical protein
MTVTIDFGFGVEGKEGGRQERGSKLPGQRKGVVEEEDEIPSGEKGKE